MPGRPGEILAQITAPGPEIEAQFQAYQEGHKVNHAKWMKDLKDDFKNLLALETATGRLASKLLVKSRKRKGEDLEGESPAKKNPVRYGQGQIRADVPKLYRYTEVKTHHTSWKQVWFLVQSPSPDKDHPNKDHFASDWLKMKS